MTTVGADIRGRYIPLRTDPETPDLLDNDRVQMVMRRWSAQDQAYLGYAKTIEEHIRMLSGRQWDVWSDLYGRFVDVLQFMTEDERKHRTRPVMDYLGYWYGLSLSKCIENPPVISFLPATADRVDAMLAEVMDPVWKTLFDEMEMDARIIRMVAWQLVAGEGYFSTRPDFQLGSKRQLIGPAVLTLDRGLGADPITRSVDAVPYDREGNPRAQLVPDPDDPENPDAYGYDVTGDPYEDLEGSPRVDVLCPLQVRAQWGQQIEWRDKRWIAVESFLLPEQVEETYGVKCDPDSYLGDDEQGAGYLERMLFGTGYFGAALQGTNVAAMLPGSTATEARLAEGYVRTITLWEKPVRGVTDQTDESPGGRMLVVAPGPTKVLWDSLRPFRTECAGPIRRVAYLDIPGRPHGSTTLERMVPLQKRLNRIEAHISQHTNLCTDPILMVHEATGIDPDEFVARPGLVITHGYNGTGDPAKYLVPPELSADVYREKDGVREQLFVIGGITGNQGNAPTANASGELVEQLRFNSDRPLAPLTRSLVLGIADVAEDVQAILPTLWDQEKLISYAGDDNVIRTVTVLPEMFKGRVNVKPSIESAAVESKERKQNRLFQLYEMGAFGNLADPMQQAKATRQLLSLLQFPDLNRAARPGGIDRVMAEHNLGRLVRGDAAAEIPLLEVYDFDVHLDVIETFMKAPEYLTLDVAIQTQFLLLRANMEAAREQQQLMQIQKAGPIAQATAAAQGAVARVAQVTGPQPMPKPGADESSPAGSPSPGPQGPGASPTPPRSDSRAA